MKIIRFIAAPSLFMTIIAGDAYALGAVSRSCQFSTLSYGAQVVAAPFFVALGAPLPTLNLPLDSIAAQRFFVNEAITTDYFSVRYYLYAKATVYALRGAWTTYYNNWQWYAEYESPGWRADEVSLALKSDSKFAIYFQNRGTMYSARAGLTSIGEDVEPNLFQRFVVNGSHWYYDPVSKIQGAMRNTRAENCNLPNMGQGTGLWDR